MKTTTLAVCLVLAGPMARAAGPETYGPATAQGRAAARLLVEDGPLPGLSIAVAVGDRVVWSEAFGHASLETRAPATTATRFRIASISKAFTATLVARLAEQGTLDLDAPIRTVAPELPAHFDRVTVRHLARHTAGVRHYATGEIAVPEYYGSLEAAITVFVDDPLEFEPGTAYGYTTYGYTLLGRVIERATGTSFGEALAATVLDPLGLERVTLDNWFRVIPDRCSFYEPHEAFGVINTQPADNSVKYPGGGLLSNAEDLVRFGTALLGPGFLRRTSLDDMFAPTRLPDGAVTGYAMGWVLREDGRGRPVRGHGGRQPGVRTQLYIFPEARVVAAALTNLSNSPLGFDELQVLVEPFVELAEGAPPAPPAVEAAGQYDIEIRKGDEHIAATLEIWRGVDRELRGSLGLLREGSRIDMPLVAVSGPRVRAVVTLDPDGTGAGTAMTGRRVELKARRRSRP